MTSSSSSESNRSSSQDLLLWDMLGSAALPRAMLARDSQPVIHLHAEQREGSLTRAVKQGRDRVL